MSDYPVMSTPDRVSVDARDLRPPADRRRDSPVHVRQLIIESHIMLNLGC